MYVVELRNLCKQGTPLSKVDLGVQPGEVLSLTRAGGDGTRLARILSLDDDSWSGEFFLLDAPVHQLSPGERRELRRAELGVVYGEDRLIPELSVYENLELPLTFRTRRAERDRLIETVVDTLALAEILGAHPRSLSRRETQLVKIARAAVGSPSLFVADNLSSCLRAADWGRVCSLLRQLVARGTVLALTRESEQQAVEGDSPSPRRSPETFGASQVAISAF